MTGPARRAFSSITRADEIVLFFISDMEVRCRTISGSFDIVDAIVGSIPLAISTECCPAIEALMISFDQVEVSKTSRAIVSSTASRGIPAESVRAYFAVLIVSS